MSENRITIEHVENLFEYHTINRSQQVRIENIRKTAKELALEIVSRCPPCQLTANAVQKVKEAALLANTAISSMEL